MRFPRKGEKKRFEQGYRKRNVETEVNLPPKLGAATYHPEVTQDVACLAERNVDGLGISEV